MKLSYIKGYFFLIKEDIGIILGITLIISTNQRPVPIYSLLTWFQTILILEFFEANNKISFALRIMEFTT